MELTTALLCDFAQIRERLLFISSGGITRVFRTEFPANLGIYLALVVELDGVEMERPHELQVRIVDQDGHEITPPARGAFQVQSADRELTERVQVPIILDFRGVNVPRPGAYDVNIYLDNDRRRTLTFWAKLSSRDTLGDHVR